MYTHFFILSIASLIAFASIAGIFNASRKGKKVSLFKLLFAGVFVSAFFLFLPVHISAANDLNAFFLAIFNSMQIFTLGTDFDVISEAMVYCGKNISLAYQIWGSVLYVLAPIFTFGFVLSLFKNVLSYIRYLLMYFKDMYIFSELNERSLALASDIKKHNRRAGLVFNDVFDDEGEQSYEIIERAKKLGAVSFKKDILAVSYARHSGAKISFFAIGENETENLNQTLRLVELYKKRKDTHIYVFSTEPSSELLLTALEKGEVKVRRINEVRSLINRILYERGEVIFEKAIPSSGGIKNISALIVGMGNHGTEMLKALSWYCQMDGYRIKINAFDKDKDALDRFTAAAPELMSPDYNGVYNKGEAEYKISINPDFDVESTKFAAAISAMRDATYVFVSLGSDELNIRTAVNLRASFEREGIHPIIQAVVNNSAQKKALDGIKNYRGQAYDIEFIGDIESSYAENVIIDSELEDKALLRHLQWGSEEEFWSYEYNYRSSVASAIHDRAREICGIPGAGKKPEELTIEERDIIEPLEHRRWNAYMRADGYIYSGSTDKKSRNDLAKMHNDLVAFRALSESEKRKDSGTGKKN